jgi:signal peptidase I
MFRFAREMTSALAMALIFIVYVIQAFKIPTGSMEDSLLVGDFLLGLKFIYGAPVLPYSYKKFPAIANPKPGDVIIFKYPGADKKDYIKRCVAGPGQTLEVHGEHLLINGKEFVLPPKGKFTRNGMLENPQIIDYAPIRIPAKGDVIKPAECELREFVFLKTMIHQENPGKEVHAEFQLYIDSTFSNNQNVQIMDYYTGANANRFFNEYMNGINFGNSIQLNFNNEDWTRVSMYFTQVINQFPGRSVEIKKTIFLDHKPVPSYKVQYDNYFMMGDNRDNSMDSRYWGYLNRNFVKAKAFILYFSLDKDVPVWQLPLKIRWNRIGKLIKSWDGLNKPVPASKS